MADELTCPICGEKAKPLDDEPGDYTSFDCEKDGKFRVSHGVLETANLMNRPKQQWREALERAKKRQKPDRPFPTITSEEFIPTA
jgi:hypothetical protein